MNIDIIASPLIERLEWLFFLMGYEYWHLCNRFWLAATWVVSTNYTKLPQSRERGPTMDCPSIPHFCLDFLHSLKLINLKEHPPSTSIANKDFPLPRKPEQALWWDWFTHTTRCYVLHCLHHYECLVVHNIDSSNVGPSSCLSPR